MGKDYFADLAGDDAQRNIKLPAETLKGLAVKAALKAHIDCDGKKRIPPLSQKAAGAGKRRQQRYRILAARKSDGNFIAGAYHIIIGAGSAQMPHYPLQ